MTHGQFIFQKCQNILQRDIFISLDTNAYITPLFCLTWHYSVKIGFSLFWNASKPSKMKILFQKLGISKMQIIITCILWYMPTSHFALWDSCVCWENYFPSRPFKWGIFLLCSQYHRPWRGRQVLVSLLCI